MKAREVLAQERATCDWYDSWGSYRVCVVEPCTYHRGVLHGIELAEQENNQSNSTQRFCDQGR